MRHVSKPGRAASSNERGAGLIIHAVSSEESVFDLRTPALCGDKPGGRLGWNDFATLAPGSALPAITCGKCLKHLAVLKSKSES